MERPRLMMERPGLPRLPLPVLPNGGIDENLEEENQLFRLSTGTLKFPDDPLDYTFGANKLIDQGTIGSGNFGTVSKMMHVDTKRLMAVKRVRFHNMDGREQRRLVREHNTMTQSASCQNIVNFYGVIFHEGDCWICMELMDVSLDRLYRRVYNKLSSRLDESILGHIAVSVINALDYLKDKLKIMHRDVKPSNVLVDRRGIVKMCDFGICGELEDSVVRTHDVGCQPYLAPERITKMQAKYDVRSDVWSFGLLMYEISTGRFPYSEWTSLFAQIEAVVNGEPPQLAPEDRFEFSLEIVHFVNRCLTSNYHDRPKYHDLKKDRFYIMYSGVDSTDARERLGAYALDSLNNPEIEVA